MKNLTKPLLFTGGLLLLAGTVPAQAVQVFLRASVALNQSQPGLPDVLNEDVQNQLYQTSVTVLPGLLSDAHFNLEIWAQDDLGAPVDITSITSLTRTVHNNDTAFTYTWNGALIAPDSAAAPVAQTYNSAGVNNTGSNGLWYSQLVGTDLTNKAVREVVVSGAAIDSSTLGADLIKNDPGYQLWETWTATVNGVVAVPVTAMVTVVPEPSQLGLLGLTLVGFLRRKR